MEPITRQVKETHLRPAPGATAPRPRPFPPKTMWGLLAGVLLGALVGLLVGILLRSFALVVPGWEQLYSMGPFTFHFFWVIMGISLGILLMGVGTLLTVHHQE